MRLFTFAGFIAGIAIVAYVAHRTYKSVSRQHLNASDERYSIEDLLADQEI